MVSLLAAGVMLASSVAGPIPAAGTPSTERLVVTFRAGTPAARAEQLAAHSGTVVGRIDQLNVRVVEVPAVAVAHARGWWDRAGEVASVEAAGRVAIDWMPPDPLWDEQWEQRQVRAPKAWDIERGVRNTVVAVVDTGVQLNHPDLVDRLVDGRDVLHDDKWPADDNGHGTAVAGVVAATANSIGVAGMCSRCKVMPVKALDADGIGWWDIAADGIVWAADHHADVINLSFGGPSGGSVLQNAISYARAKGAVVVGAAGNFNTSSRFYPAAMSGVISVAGSNDYDLKFDFSNYSTSWVDLAAPGCTFTTKRGDEYGGFCGTSAATPIVSGIAALVDSAKPGVSRWQIESILFAATARMPWAFTRLGRIDAYRAVYRAIHGTLPTSAPLKPSAPLLNPRAAVTYLSGKHEGYRFDAAGAILRGTGVELEAETRIGHTSKRSRIPGRSGWWFYIVDGPLDGWWVRESDDVFLTPAATPSPTPSPTPTP